MPTTFLSLPRELRDQIYEYILISPTGLIQPILIRHPTKAERSHQHHHQSKSQPKTKTSSQALSRNDPKSRFTLYTNLFLFSPVSIHVQRPKEDKTSLSILRVCRQITLEAQSLFWNHNTFYFSNFHPSPNAYRNNIGVLKTLKQMGQTASRLIQFITIRMSDLNAHTSTLGKILLKLESRARYGEFKKLTLVWEEEEWKELTTIYNLSGITTLEEDRFLHDLLDGLAVGKEGGRFERAIEVEQDWVESKWCQGKMTRCMSTAKALHFAFGGKLFIGGRLTWERYQQVGSVGGV